MWTCPECGRSFANRNQAHACQSTTVEEYLAGRTALAVSIYRVVVETLRHAGEFRIHPQKSRIAFISRMTFASVSLAREWADLSLILPDPLDDSRIRKLELYGPTSWGHSIRLTSPEDVDEDVREWLAESLRRGNQETLDPSHEVVPLSAAQLEIFWTGFRARVENARIRLPGYIADALALIDHVDAQVGGHREEVALVHSADSVFIEVSPETGLGEGDRVDVFLRVST